jgi:hypothetical protein
MSNKKGGRALTNFLQKKEGISGRKREKSLI